MKKIIGNIFVTLLVIMIIFMSVLLLSFNEFKVSVLGNTTVLIVDKNVGNFKEGSVLLVKGVNSNDVKNGDNIFYYDTSSKKVETKAGTVREVYQVVNGEQSFLMPEDYVLDGSYVIGRVDDAKEYKNIGKVLSVLESKWGSLFLVVMPALILFVYEVIDVIVMVKRYKNKKRIKKIIYVDEEEDDE